MKIKISEASGPVLDWLVAKCEQWDGSGDRALWLLDHEAGVSFFPSTDWAQGGPIIERERLSLHYSGNKGRPYYATHPNAGRKAQRDGPTPLIAAMCCYVASRLGDEVEVPEELCESK